MKFKVQGVGGHAAIPHLTIDPVSTSAKIITAAQTLISRELSPLESGVVSFSAVHGGQAHNVIPSEVLLKGTIRSLTTEGKDHLKQRLSEMAGHIAAADRCTIEFITVGNDYPETRNDPELFQSVHEMAERIVGKDNFPISQPTMGGEDFAFYGAHAPTCFVGLGCRNESIGSTYGVHHPKFKMDESVLHLGSALHVAFALENL